MCRHEETEAFELSEVTTKPSLPDWVLGHTTL